MFWYGVIYMVTCVITGKIYIGMTNDFEYRKGQHIRMAFNNFRENNKFHNSLFKYGLKNHIWKIIDWSSTLEGLKEQEIYWIAKKDTFHYGLNGTPGGDGFGSGKDHPFFGITFSKEHRRKQSLASKGKPKSKQHIEALREAFKTRPELPLEARKIIGKKTGRRWVRWRKENGKEINIRYLPKTHPRFLEYERLKRIHKSEAVTRRWVEWRKQKQRT